MSRPLVVLSTVLLLVLQAVAVSALTEDEAKQAWREAKRVSAEKQALHRDAKVEFAGNKSDENRQAVVDTGKAVLNAALDEAEAWLVWKRVESDNNPDIPEDLKAAIRADVETNIGKVAGLRADVAAVTNQVQLGVVFLKMVGKYGELVTDVARDAGKILVHIGNTWLATAEDYEAKLRQEAEKMENNGEVLAKLDAAKSSLAEARSNVGKAEASYNQVVLPGTPLIKFAEGNGYMRVARTNLLSALASLQQAYDLMMRGG